MTVEYREFDQVNYRNGEPGVRNDGSYRTPEGDHLVSEPEKATYLRTVQDWIDETESCIVAWPRRRHEPGLGKAMGRPSMRCAPRTTAPSPGCDPWP